MVNRRESASACEYPPFWFSIYYLVTIAGPPPLPAEAFRDEGSAAGSR
jgi:hypothetical protein